MRQFTNIIVFVEGDSPLPPVLGRVTELAKRSGATVKLVTVIEPFPWYTRLFIPASAKIQRQLIQENADRLDSLAIPLRGEGLDVASKVLCGRRALELCREVLRADHDLLVKVAEPDRGTSLGSTDMRLLRTCPCPCLLFRPGSGDRPLRRIVVAVDPAPAPDVPEVLLHLREEIRPDEQALNVKLLELGRSLAQVDHGELHIVHAWSAPGEDLLRSEGRLPRQEVDDYVASLHEEARKSVARLLQGFPNESPQLHVHLMKGHPPDVITEFSKSHDCDLIVMGTIVRTGLPGILIGSTAETVFHRVECSVLAAKSDSFVTPVGLDGESDNP
jgi:universal stress protein E